MARAFDFFRSSTPHSVCGQLEAVYEPSRDTGESPMANKSQPTTAGTTQRPRAHARAAAKSKQVSDSFIARHLTGTLETAPGHEALNVKDYFDKIPMDASDVAFARDPAALAKYHSDMANLIASRLKVHAPTADPSVRRAVAAAKQSFTDGLQAAKQTVANYYQARRSWDGSRASNPGDQPRHATEFHGFRADVNGRNRDMLSSPSKDVRPNFQVQRPGAAAGFVHWSSAKYLEARAVQQAPGLHDRIYLNPRSGHAVDVFGRIIDKAEQAGLRVKAKILQRDIEGNSRMRDDNPAPIRGDSIVLYASPAESEQLLKIAKDVHGEVPDAFDGRNVSRMPLKIADGVGVSSEPTDTAKAEGKVKGEMQGEGDVSLTSHRAEVLENVAGKVREQFDARDVRDVANPSSPTRQQILDAYRQELAKECEKEGINPHNLAFNKEDAAVPDQTVGAPSTSTPTQTQQAAAQQRPGQQTPTPQAPAQPAAGQHASAIMRPPARHESVGLLYTPRHARDHQSSSQPSVLTRLAADHSDRQTYTQQPDSGGYAEEVEKVRAEQEVDERHQDQGQHQNDNADVDGVGI